MRFIKGKLAWLSVLLLAGGYVAAPRTGIAQQRGGHESHSMQAAPQRTQPNSARSNNFGRVRGNQGFQRNFQSNEGGRWGNNFGSHQFAENRRDRGDRDRDRDRGERHDRDRGHFDLYWGAPLYPYSYNQGFYYGAPNGYYAGNTYDIGYSDGYNAGRYDRVNGNIYNPRQYERSGDPDYFSGFVAGYEDGWRS